MCIKSVVYDGTCLFTTEHMFYKPWIDLLPVVQ